MSCSRSLESVSQFLELKGPVLERMCKQNRANYDLPLAHMATQHNATQKCSDDWPRFLNSTGRLNRKQRTVRFPVGTKTTEAEVRAPLAFPGSPWWGGKKST